MYITYYMSIFCLLILFNAPLLNKSINYLISLNLTDPITTEQ